MREPFDRLLDMLEAIAKIQAHTSDGRGPFDDDDMVHVWVIHHLAVIGEAASALPPEWRTRYRDVPWGRIVACRNHLIHAYHDIDADRIWEIVADDLPVLETTIRRMLRDMGREDEHR